MRAALDTIILATWAELAVGAVFWFLCTAYGADDPTSPCHQVGRLLVTGFPLLSAWRVQHNYRIPRAPWWAAAFWLFSLLWLMSYVGQRKELLQTSLMMASILFIAVPLPVLRVWGVLGGLLGLRKAKDD